MVIKFLIYLLGPPFVRPATAGMTSESFVGTASLRDRLGRSLITTTAPSTAGKKTIFLVTVAALSITGQLHWNLYTTKSLV